MDKIDLEGFLIKNKLILIGSLIFIILVIGAVFVVFLEHGNGSEIAVGKIR